MKTADAPTGTLDVTTPALDSLNARHQSPLTFTGQSDELQVRVPSTNQIVSLACGTDRLDLPGIILGSVVARGDSIPPRGAKIVAEWTDVSVQSAGVIKQPKCVVKISVLICCFCL